MEERGEPKHSQRGGRGRDSREEPRGNQEGESLEECRINVSVIPVDLALNPQRLRPSSPGSRVRSVFGPIVVLWLVSGRRTPRRPIAPRSGSVEGAPLAVWT